MFRIRTLLVVASLATLAACTPPKGPTGPTRPLTEWTGEVATMLDDGVDVGALPANDSPPGRDETSEALIPRRMEVSDAVVVGKVIAFSAEPVGDKRRFRLELTIAETLIGPPPTSALVLKVEPESPAYGTIRAIDTRIIGKKLVVFFQQYAADDGGEPITHFHLSPATAPVLDAIATQKTKREFH